MIEEPKRVPGLCKHDAVTAEYSFKAKPNLKKKRTVHLFNKANWDKIKSDLKEFRGTFLQDFRQSNAQENWDRFKKKINTIMSEHVPSKILKGKRDLPFLNTRCRKVIRSRRRAYDKARITNHHHHHHLWLCNLFAGGMESTTGYSPPVWGLLLALA